MNVIKSAPTLKVICVAFGIALFCCLGFSLKAYNDFLDIKILLNNEKLAIMNDLRKSKDSLDVAIFENSGIKAELIIEKQKVNKLLSEISLADIDVASLIKYKNEVNRLKTLIASLSKEKEQLKLNCDLVKTQRDSTISVLNNTKNLKHTLVAINANLKSTVKKAARLTVINLKTTSFKQFNNGRLKETDKARKVDVLQISFTVVGTKISKPCNKEYYVQIIDSNNNVVGERKSKKFGEKILDYSYETPVKFNNETMEVSAELALENIEKGNYFVSVFDKDELASKTTFALR